RNQTCYKVSDGCCDSVVQVAAVGQRTDRRGDQRRGGQDSLGAAALEGQLGSHLMPAVPDSAEHIGVGHEDVVEEDLVEMVLTRHQLDRADRHAGRVAWYEKLAELGV